MSQEYQKIDYIDNATLYAEYVEYRKSMKAAEEAGLERPELTKPICLAIIQIATNLANRYNFVNYSYKQELIGDAILKATMKGHLFDPEVTKNPFAYLTAICFWEMVNTIKKEHKEVSKKAKYIRENVTSEFIQSLDNEEGDFKNNFVEFLKENDVYRDYIEESKTAPKKVVFGVRPPNNKGKKAARVADESMPIEEATIDSILEQLEKEKDLDE